MKPEWRRRRETRSQGEQIVGNSSPWSYSVEEYRWSYILNTKQSILIFGEPKKQEYKKLTYVTDLYNVLCFNHTQMEDNYVWEIYLLIKNSSREWDLYFFRRQWLTIVIDCLFWKLCGEWVNFKCLYRHKLLYMHSKLVKMGCT